MRRTSVCERNQQLELLVGEALSVAGAGRPGTTVARKPAGAAASDGRAPRAEGEQCGAAAAAPGPREAAPAP
jgi:hypothetical protein